MFQAQVRIHLLQATVLFFQLLQTSQFTYRHAAVFRFPFVKGGFAEPMLADQFFQGHTGFCFLEDIHNLAFRKLRLLHGYGSWLYFAMSYLLLSGMILREAYLSCGDVFDISLFKN